jgi:hypothetical protein
MMIEPSAWRGSRPGAQPPDRSAPPLSGPGREASVGRSSSGLERSGQPPPARCARASPRNVASRPATAGRDLAACARGIAGQQVPGVIIATGQRRGTGVQRAGEGAGEIGQSSKAPVKRLSGTLCAGPDRATPRAPDSGARGGRPPGGKSSTRACGRNGARVDERSHVRASAVGRQSSRPTQRRGEARTMSPGGRDSVGTRWGPTPAPDRPGCVRGRHRLSRIAVRRGVG